MGVRVSGVKYVSWLLAAALCCGFGALACGDDDAGSPGAGGGADGGSGSGGSDGSQDMAGSPAVNPADLVCNSDADCSSADKPVCDQVLGCVACQYDWDCPADHRCRSNECFEKRACTESADCAGDASHPVCDAVQQLCVGCREDGECGGGERCEDSECVAFEACTNSRDCGNGKVCDRAAGACVACVVDGDCGDDNACVDNACVPTCATDKDCLGVGKLCDLAVSRCVECLGHADCPESYFCGLSGRCELDACQPGQTRCENQQLLATCSALGDGFTTSSCAGNARCVEQDEAASCVPLACVPGATSCSDDGASLVTCSADGLSVTSSEPCPQGKACHDGVCSDVVCDPNAAICQGAALYKCNASGTAQSLVKVCSEYSGQSCSEALGDCKQRACTPGAPLCDGELATACAEDGSGPQPNGTDCSAQQRACWNGTCRAVVCSDAYVCNGSVLQHCVSNGTALQAVQDCDFASLCDASGAKCITPVCTPNAFVCDGSVATRCKADGSGYQPNGTDCAAADEVCDGGGCLPKVCEPNVTFCSGGSPQTCAASGGQYVPSDTCSANEHCVEGSQFCQYDKCTAGSAVCNGSLATTCASDGSGPVTGGIDCAANQQVCEGGACKPVLCQPGARSCQGEAVYQCTSTGTGTSLYDSCSGAEFCDVSAETPICAPDVCSAGSLGCNGEVISTCGANGGSWTSPGTNCKLSSQVCIVGGTCAAEEVATQGSAYGTLNRSNVTSFSAFRVLTSRKLSKLELYASVKGVQKFTWLVYEKRAGSETYDLVYQNVTAHTQPTAAFISSPALDFTLEQGKSYAVGVHVSGPAQLAYHPSTLPKASFFTTPFGGLTSASAQPAASLVPYADYAVYLRFTTVLP